MSEARIEGERAFEAGRVDQAVDLFRQAVAAAPDDVEAKAALGRALLERGDLPDAAPLFVEVYGAWKRAHGPEDARAELALRDLARTLVAGGTLVGARKAAELYAQVLTFLPRALGGTHPEVAATHRDLGEMHWKVAQHSAAEAHLRQALTIQEGGDPGELAATLFWLGHVCSNTSRHDEAREHRRRAAELYESALAAEESGPRRGQRVQRLLAGQIEAVRFRGFTPDEIAPLYERLLAEQAATLGADHLAVAWTHAQAGDLLGFSDLECARTHYLAAAAIREKHLGPHHEATLAPIDLLAQACVQAGLFAEAETHQRRLAAAAAERSGEDAFRVAARWAAVGVSVAAQERHAEAEEILRRSVHVMEKLYTDQVLTFPHTLRELVKVYDAQGKLAEARAVQERLLEHARRADGEDAASVCVALTDLAALCARAEDFVAAEAHAEAALALAERTRLGPSYRDAAMTKLAHALGHSSQPALGVPWFERALLLWTEDSRYHHGAALKILDPLAWLCHALGRPEDEEKHLHRALGHAQAHGGVSAGTLDVLHERLARATLA